MQIVSTPRSSAKQPNDGLITFVVPLDENVARFSRFARHVNVIFDSQPRRHEFLVVANGSGDMALAQTLAMAESLETQCRHVSFDSGLGSDEALRAAVTHADGATAVVLDRIPNRCSRELSELLRALAVQRSAPISSRRPCTDQYECGHDSSAGGRGSAAVRSCTY